MQLLIFLNNCSEFKVLTILVILDSIFGALRAIREKQFNSNIGIDGLIRKFGMMISVIFFISIDIIENINLIGFIPEELRKAVNIEYFGISSMFLWLFIIYESLSILKNMIKCKLPIPKKFQNYLEKIFKTYTSELEEGDKK